ncbi:MAG: ATP-binding protein [Myxococcota bacterium]
MSASAVIDLKLGDLRRLEEVADREALSQLCRSFFELFGLSIRVFSEGGALLADVHEERSICRYVNTLPGGRRSCAATVGEVKGLRPNATAVHPCFTGAVYRVTPIEYQGRQVGRVVIGPYLPIETGQVPKSLLVVDPEVQSEEARRHLEEMPRVRAETAIRIGEHLRGIVDLLLFASHRAHLTSEMHIASVRESYRELTEKTERLQQAFDQLKELDRLKSNFLATVSHELRTPLTSIIGYSEMLASGMAGELNQEQLEFAETIHTKGDHLLELISSLLDLSKLEQGSLKLARREVTPSDILHDVATTLIPRASKKNIRVQVESAEHVGTVSGDPVRIRQILSNLGDNALKFTPEGGTVFLSAGTTELDDHEDGGSGHVLFGASRPAVEFVVRDTGMGIPKGELPRIFNAFYQVDGSSTREHGGVGLGLSIVQRLTEAHEGTIAVESEVGAGTTFRVVLPEQPTEG